MSPAAAPDGPDERVLEEERAFLLRSLRDLDDELAAGDIDANDHAALKDGYTARAAAVLRSLDAGPGGAGVDGGRGGSGTDASVPAVSSRDVTARDPKQALPGTARERAAARRGRSQRARRRFVAASMVVVFAGVGLALVAGNASRRGAGQGLTGNIPSTGAEAQLAQARGDLGNGQYLEAVKIYDAVIRQDPKNPEALAYRGWLLRLTGDAANDRSLVERGLASVRAAEAADPTYPDAHFFAGEILLRDEHDPSGAAAEFRLMLSENPPPAMVPEVQGELNSALAQIPTSSAPTTSPPAGH